MSRPSLSRVVALAALVAGCAEADDLPPPPLEPGRCAAGERPEGETCILAGVPPQECIGGFEPDGGGGCRPILPADPCSPGLMAVPGDTSCRPVAACGEGSWGDIQVEATTEYVDAAFTGVSDGTAQQPWTTIQQGVDAAEPGAIVAVAEGSYMEMVSILTKPVRLWGRCPDRVSVVAPAGESAAVRVLTGADGSLVRGLALSSGNWGLLLSGSEGVLLEELWIHDTPHVGLVSEGLFGPTASTLRGALIEQTARAGAFASGVELTVERSAIRDTAPLEPASGWAILSQYHEVTDDKGRLLVQGSLIERSAGRGIYIAGSDADVEGSVIRDVGGAGVSVGYTVLPGVLERGNVSVRGSVIERVRGGALLVANADLVVESTTARDIEPETGPTGPFARGAGAQTDATGPGRATLTMRTSLIDRAHEIGVYIDGSDATIESTWIRDTTAPSPAARFGLGLVVQDGVVTLEPSTARIAWSRVERSIEQGILVNGSDATVDATWVGDTRASLFDGAFGDGVAVVFLNRPATLVVERSLVQASQRAGIAAFGAHVSVANDVLLCNTIALDGEPYQGQAFSFEDGGGNGCGCGDASVPCQVLTSSLTPPDLIP